jgi:hypothetical protein
MSSGHLEHRRCAGCSNNIGRRWAWSFPKAPLGAQTVALIIRVTGGNFRLLDRLLQIQRILEINALADLTKAAVEAARESLVIGQV